MRSIKLAQTGIGLLALALLGFAPSGFTAEAPDAEVEIIKFQFLPQEIHIKAGDRVRWTNKEKRQYHSVWFEAAGEPEPDYFFPDETYERRFDEPGTYPYRCGPHPKMKGVVHVE